MILTETVLSETHVLLDCTFRYYLTDLDVKEDKELQHWADLVSLEGNQTASSRGMVCIISTSCIMNPRLACGCCRDFDLLSCSTSVC